MEDERQLAAMPSLSLASPASTESLSVDAGSATLPFPGNFIGSFEDDGRVRLTVERLAFDVRDVSTQDQLFQAVSIRYQAYSRHLPELARHLLAPEPQDTEPGYSVLLAENRLDRSPLATVRIQTNEHGPLALERSLELPKWLAGRSLAEATRLAVADGVRGRFVTLVMFKAYFQFCLERDIDWMVICARSPLDRIYLSLLFRDVIPGGEYIALKHSANIPHRALAFNVKTAEERWRSARHPLYGFMGLTLHPDIKVGIPAASAVPNTSYYRDRLAAQ